jgi:hypothetical protein
LTNKASGNNEPGFLGFKDYHDFTEEKEYIFDQEKEAQNPLKRPLRGLRGRRILIKGVQPCLIH